MLMFDIKKVSDIAKNAGLTSIYEMIALLLSIFNATIEIRCRYCNAFFTKFLVGHGIAIGGIFQKNGKFKWKEK